MALTPGSQLGPHKILAALGSGGQGEVYKAWDTRLDRNVALKVLPAHLRTNPELKQRFDREARALASLDHPHIVQIHDTGSQDGIDFLVMEFLEGETVAARLERGALPLDQALRYGIEIADALDKVHRKGVTHRDVKSNNIIISEAGTKLLDFGLAKVRREVAQANVPLSQLPTVGGTLTGDGRILGTLQYMSPEQLEGKEADGRSDIFSFGATLYEMVTGKKAFEGTSQASVIAAILERDPPSLSAAEPRAPAQLDRVVRKCLAKQPEKRWQAASDLHDALKWIAEGDSVAATPAPAAAEPQRKGSLSDPRLAWGLAAVLAAALISVVLYFRGAPGATAEAPPMRLDIVTPPTSDPISLALSPDGRRLVFVASSEGSEHLWLRSLDAVSAQPLAGTEGAKDPFWSADSRSIGFFAQGKLKRIDVAGGAPHVLASAPNGRGGTWNRDDVIVFVPTPESPLYRISASGGDAVAITKLDPPRQTTQRFPQFLPDGRRLLFSAGVPGPVAGQDLVPPIGNNTRSRPTAASS